MSKKQSVSAVVSGFAILVSIFEWNMLIVNTLWEKEFALFDIDTYNTKEEYLIKTNDLKVVALKE